MGDRIDLDAGLSPRVRGNRQAIFEMVSDEGSIPACAGEPRTRTTTSRAGGVYPRVCGGTTCPVRASISVRGLSPRVRGNRQSKRAGGGVSGSIPACAGEPSARTSNNGMARVYPRVCGGTSPPTRGARGAGGLSPRVRGNHEGAGERVRWSGSIPACAGEPMRFAARTMGRRVYPRVCGGTPLGHGPAARAAGLSPRVRGNLRIVARTARCAGSIPACAGEPRRGPRSAARPRVYPRVCGGTTGPITQGLQSRGLSPRVRGNPPRDRDGGGRGRSIPACAGEPEERDVKEIYTWVYPRVCGGTSSRAAPNGGMTGLSPRVRGNRIGPHERLALAGSIPACAGEPGAA